MDNRVKIDTEIVPSALAFIKRNRNLTINGLTFGLSDQFDGVVSQPCRESDFAPFDGVPGYYLIDASDGRVVREPAARIVTEKTEDPGKPQANPEQVYAARFLEQFEENSKSERERTPNDEYKRALKALGVAVDPDATKADMIELIEGYLTQ